MTAAATVARDLMYHVAVPIPLTQPKFGEAAALEQAAHQLRDTAQRLTNVLGTIDPRADRHRVTPPFVPATGYWVTGEGSDDERATLRTSVTACGQAVDHIDTVRQALNDLAETRPDDAHVSYLSALVQSAEMLLRHVADEIKGRATPNRDAPDSRTDAET
ncbi:hypothetical protein ACFQ1S_06935 [Kibdelosporangium lantanae]|uniref:Uncharacterized protein n=1 Tax=Kibdelosporangium lantanae TaxID=1497396 RepID=A0ABW3M3T9_9PSEU